MVPGAEMHGRLGTLVGQLVLRGTGRGCHHRLAGGVCGIAGSSSQGGRVVIHSVQSGRVHKEGRALVGLREPWGR